MNATNRASLRTLSALFLLTVLLLAAGAARAPRVARASASRDISGSTVTGTPLYRPGSSQIFYFTATNASPDGAWLDNVELTFPASWTITGATNDETDSCGNTVSILTQISSNHIAFTDNDDGFGEIEDGCSWDVSVTVTVPAATGDQTVNWHLSSDGVGSTPHEVLGNLTLGEADQNVYLPLVLRDYPRKFAIVVGVADYAQVRDLAYTDDDAVSFHQELLADGGFASDNVLLLLDSNATKANIQDKITSWLAPRENRDDLVIFYFAGHGSNGSDVSPYDESDGQDEYILPYDADQYGSNYIRDDELDTWLDGLDSQHVVVILDTCYSGGFIGSAALQEELRCRCLPAADGARAQALPGDGFARDIDGSGRLVITASAEDESSYESDSLGHGVFTYYLLQGLDRSSADTHDGNGWISGEEAYDYLAPRVSSYTSDQQNPQQSDGVPGEVDLATP